MATDRGPRDPTEDSLAEIWEDMLRVARVDIDTSFFALGGDMALAATMLDRVQEVLDCHVPLERFVLDATVEGLAAEVDEASEHGQPFACGPTAFPPMAEGARTPFFFVADRSAMRLVRALGRDRASHLVPYVSERRPGIGSIEAAAALCISTLRGLQEKGPYYLGGFSLGALVAFEMALRLRAQGETVPALILVGPKPWSHRWLTWRRFHFIAPVFGLRGERARRVFGRLTELVLHWEGHLVARLRRPLRETIAGAIRRVRKKLRLSMHLLRGASSEDRRPNIKPVVPAKVRARRTRYQSWREAYQFVSRAYVPGSYPGRLSILWPEDDHWDRAGRPADVWREAMAQVDLRIVPGNHATCLTRHVEVLAEEIRACLDRKPPADQNRSGTEVRR